MEVTGPWSSSDTPFSRAVRAGVAADRVGTAFLAGYREALSALIPGLTCASLAATEDGPVHPRTFTTRLEDGHLHGHKRWVTGVPGADHLVVIAVAGEDEDRRRIVAAVIPVDAPGVRVIPSSWASVAEPQSPVPRLSGIRGFEGAEPPGRPVVNSPTAFVPDVPHAEVVFDGVRADRVLPGDGWSDVVRPFRTVEDVHVIAAVHGYLIGASGRAGFGRDAVAALAGTLAALAAIAGSDPRDPAVHVALGGVLATFRATVAGLVWGGDPDEAARWARDVPLLSVAERARVARLEAAWGRAVSREP